jgi:hypothetical protein
LTRAFDRWPWLLPWRDNKLCPSLTAWPGFPNPPSLQPPPPSIGKLHDMDAARATVQSAVLHRHAIFSAAAARDLEGLVRDSREFRCLFDRSNGGEAGGDAEEEGEGGQPAKKRRLGEGPSEPSAVAAAAASEAAAAAAAEDAAGEEAEAAPLAPLPPPPDGPAGELQVGIEGLLRSRRLCLVLDLDHTLINSAKFGEVEPEVEYRLQDMLADQVRFYNTHTHTPNTHTPYTHAPTTHAQTRTHQHARINSHARHQPGGRPGPGALPPAARGNVDQAAARRARDAAARGAALRAVYPHGGCVRVVPVALGATASIFQHIPHAQRTHNTAKHTHTHHPRRQPVLRRRHGGAAGPPLLWGPDHRAAGRRRGAAGGVEC